MVRFSAVEEPRGAQARAPPRDAAVGPLYPRSPRAVRRGLAWNNVHRRCERANNKLENQTGIVFPWEFRVCAQGWACASFAGERAARGGELVESCLVPGPFGTLEPPFPVSFLSCLRVVGHFKARKRRRVQKNGHFLTGRGKSKERMKGNTSVSIYVGYLIYPIKIPLTLK